MKKSNFIFLVMLERIPFYFYPKNFEIMPLVKRYEGYMETAE